MIGFNGGLIGKTRIYAYDGAVNTGVWSLREELTNSRLAAASGGVITNVSDGGVTYRVHTFIAATTPKTFTITRAGEFEYLVVGGGGGGGSSSPAPQDNRGNDIGFSAVGSRAGSVGGAG